MMSETNTPLLPEMADLWQQTLNWQPTVEQQGKFQRLYELILEGNRQLNLTRITEPQEFWEKHLWDSLRGVARLKGRGAYASGVPEGWGVERSASRRVGGEKVIDIGTGAGFPGIPVAIANPAWHVTLLDSIRKKITFLDTLLARLSIQNANTAIGRAEIVGKQQRHRQTYDLALIRAVGSANLCAEYALPLLKPDGLAVLYRGNWTASEAQDLQSHVERLGGVIEATEKFTTPLSQSDRHCLYLRKVP